MKLEILVNGQDPKELLKEYKRQALARKEKARIEQGFKINKTPNTATPKPNHIIGSSQIRQLPNGNFLFYEVPYQGGILECIERPMEYLDNGTSKTLTNHLEWISDPKNKLQGYTIADMELEYQLLRISYDKRNDPKKGIIANYYINKIRELYNNWIITADTIEYGNGLEAVITNRGRIPAKIHKILTIPELTNNYATLSKERPQEQLNEINPIDKTLSAFLKEYLGQGHEQAGIIVSYCATPRNGKLRETTVWTQSQIERKADPKLDGSIGRYVDGRMVICAGGEFERRALAVALRTKDFYKQEDITQ